MAEPKDTKRLDELLARIPEMQEKARQREKAAKKVAVPDRQMKLELWPEEVRGMPNAVLRGALFGMSTTRRIHKKRTLIAAVDGYEVRFKGETFNQADLDVFENLLHIAAPHPMGKRVEFSVHAFLKTLGRGTSGRHHEEFKEQIMRLVTGGIEITDKKAGISFMSTFVSKAYREDATGRYVVIMDKDMLSLYEAGYTLIDWRQRLELGRDNLAKWLQGFYSTHAAPYPYKVQTLHNLCGSDDKQLFSFRQKLRKALNKLVQIGAIDGWEIDDDDLVTVRRKPSASQQKHLKRTAKRR